MEALIYNPQTLSYEVPPTETEHKAAIIHDINLIQMQIGKRPLTMAQFDLFMTMPIDELTSIVNDQASALHRAKLGL